MPKQHFFGYLQMKHFITSQVTSFSVNLPCSDIENFILERQMENISYFIHFSVPLTDMSRQTFLVNEKEI